jgi:tRNA(Ile)-lysidine synthase
VHQTVAKVWRFIQQERMLSPSDKVILGVSGGADSTVMLHIFRALTTKLWPAGSIVVAHLNHNLRGKESDGDKEFVGELCAGLNVECVIESADVREIADNSKENLEAAARRLRYEFFHRVAIQHGATKVATAHTVNDQAETFLLRLIRGSGGAGLGGIAPVRLLMQQNDRDQTSVPLIRPLLGITRDEIISYCEDNHLDYRTDSSNFSLDYSRNKVRHEILPQLALLNPQVISVLSESANRLRTDEAFLQSQAVELLNAELKRDPKNGSLMISVKALLETPSSLRVRMIREMVRRARGDLFQITARHLASIDSLLKQGKSGKTVRAPGLRVERQFDTLVFINTTKTTESTAELKLAGSYLHLLAENSGEVRVRLNNRELIIRLIRTEKYVWGERSRFTGLLDATRIDLPLTVRPRREGDRYAKIGRGKSTKVKELMIENRVPLNDRITYPVIATRDDEIVWIPGLPVPAKFAAGSETKEWVVLSAIFAESNRSE